MFEKQGRSADLGCAAHGQDARATNALLALWRLRLMLNWR
jgi:hypothetical protein